MRCFVIIKDILTCCTFQLKNLNIIARRITYSLLWNAGSKNIHRTFSRHLSWESPDIGTFLTKKSHQYSRLVMRYELQETPSKWNRPTSRNSINCKFTTTKKNGSNTSFLIYIHRVTTYSLCEHSYYFYVLEQNILNKVDNNFIYAQATVKM